MRYHNFIVWCDKIMAFSFYAMIYFLPISIALIEIFSTIAIISFLLKRFAVFCSQLQLGALGWENYSISKKVLFFLKSFKPIPNDLNLPIALYLIVCFFSIFISLYPSVSFKGFLGKALEDAFLYFCFIECINSRKRIRIFLIIFALSVTVTCLNGLFQHYIGYDFIFNQPINDGRISSSLRQANDFGGYLVIVIPIFLCLLFGMGGNKMRIRIPTFILFVLSIACLAFTYSRGAWLGFMVSLILLAKQNRKFLVFSVILVVLFSGICFPSLMETREQFREKHSVKELGWKGYYERVYISSNRNLYWDGAIKIIKDHPILGLGLNSYSLVSRDYAQAKKIRSGGYPHNCYLQMTAEIGLVGLAAFLWLIIAIFKNSFMAMPKIKDEFARSLLLGLLMGLLAFLIHAFWDTILYSVQLSTLMWIVMGIITTIQKIELEGTTRGLN